MELPGSVGLPHSQLKVDLTELGQMAADFQAKDMPVLRGLRIA